MLAATRFDTSIFMRKILKLLLFILVLNHDKVFADATPFKDNEQIELVYKTSNKLILDSCGVIYRNFQTNQPDTFFNCNGAECIYVLDAKNIRLIRFIPDTSKIILCFKGKTLISPALKRNGPNSYHKLLITDTEIKDITPIFKTPYLNYFIALLTTILLELLIAFIYFWRHKIPFKNLKYVIYVNLLTHPILWLISANFTGFALGNLIGEPVVVLIEGLLLYKLINSSLTIGKSIWLSFLMNVVSFIFGGLIYFVVTS